MDESKTKVLIAVAPDAPEWMRSAAKAMAEEAESAHGVIMLLCREESQLLLIEHANGEDLVQAMANLADSIRVELDGPLAEALIQLATREETEEEA